jgi:hypothetical protein
MNFCAQKSVLPKTTLFITEQHLHWRAQVLINKGQSDDQKDVWVWHLAGCHFAGWQDNTATTQNVDVTINQNITGF